MQLNVKTLIISVFLLSMLAGNSPGISDEEIALMKEASPIEAFIEPDSPRKVLVFSHCEGYEHSSIPYFEKALEIMAEQTGAFTVTISTDMSVFEDGLDEYDVVCFNNTTRLEPTESQQEGLLEFLNAGKGVVGIHGATDNFYEWQEGAAIMGGYFDGHPWGSGDTWAIKVTEPEHPLNKMFEEPGFKLNDEIYRIKPVSLDECRILLELDFDDHDTRAADPEIERVPVSWIRNYGNGRVFYSGLGHNHHIFWNEEVLSHFLAGVQFAAGDFEAPAEPLEKELIQALRPLLENIADYQYGDNQRSKYQLTDIVRRFSGISEGRRVLEKEFLKVLGNDISGAGRDFLLRQLGIIGSSESVELLANMLKAPEVCQMARHAMETIPGSEADEALRKQLEESEDDIVSIGIIGTLGHRRDAGSVEQLAQIIDEKNEHLAIAAANALGSIASSDAEDALARLQGNVEGRVLNELLHARLSCAADFVQDQKVSRAMGVYEQLLGESMPVQVQVGALQGFVEIGADGTDERIVNIIGSRSGRLQMAAIMLSAKVESEQIVSLLGELMPETDEQTQITVLAALSKRADISAMPYVKKAAQSDNVSVRVAALEALKNTGDGSAVEFLAVRAAETTGQEQRAARESLYAIPGQDVNSTIIDLVPETPQRVKAELLTAIGQRYMDNGIELLLKNAASDEAEIASASMGGLRRIGNKEQFPQLVDLMLNVESSMQGQVEHTILTVLNRCGGSDILTDSALQYLPTEDVDSHALLLNLLGHSGYKKGLDVILEGLESQENVIKRASIDAAGNWPGCEVVEPLLKVVSETDERTHRVVAFRAAVSRASECGEVADRQRLQLLGKCIDVAPDANEARRILPALREIHLVESVKLTSKLLNKPGLEDEAATTIARISKNLPKGDLQEIEPILQKAHEATQNAEVRQDIAELINEVQ